MQRKALYLSTPTDHTLVGIRFIQAELSKKIKMLHIHSLLFLVGTAVAKSPINQSCGFFSESYLPIKSTPDSRRRHRVTAWVLEWDCVCHSRYESITLTLSHPPLDQYPCSNPLLSNQLIAGRNDHNRNSAVVV